MSSPVLPFSSFYLNIHIDLELGHMEFASLALYTWILGIMPMGTEDVAKHMFILLIVYSYVHAGNSG